MNPLDIRFRESDFENPIIIYGKCIVATRELKTVLLCQQYPFFDCL